MRDSKHFLPLAEFEVSIELGVFPMENMRRDEELAHTLPRDEAVLRLYSWNPYAISLGYHQKEEGIDRERAAADGIEIVRRPTGGRAVLHSDELTYAAVFRVPDQTPIGAVHDEIVDLLLRGIRTLGLTDGEAAVTEPTGRHTREEYTTDGPSRWACFASTSRHEATFEGKKFIGSAQRRFGNVVLQHGSILLSDDHARIADYLVGTRESKAVVRQRLLEQTTSLSAMFGSIISAEKCAIAIKSYLHAEAALLTTSTVRPLTIAE